MRQGVGWLRLFPALMIMLVDQVGQISQWIVGHVNVQLPAIGCRIELSDHFVFVHHLNQCMCVEFNLRPEREVFVEPFHGPVVFMFFIRCIIALGMTHQLIQLDTHGCWTWATAAGYDSMGVIACHEVCSLLLFEALIDSG